MSNSLRERPARYSQLSQDENEPAVADDPAAERKRRAARINSYVHSALWVAAAIFIIYYGDMYRVIRTDPRVEKIFLYLGYASVCVQISLIFYMVIVLPRQLQREIHDYMQASPNAVYATIIASLFTWLMFVIALWPIWGFVTPVMLTVIGIAAIFSTNFLPNWC